MNIIIWILSILAFNFISFSCNACSLSDSFCKNDNGTLNCYGNISNTNEELQPFQEILQSNTKIMELSLESACVAAGELDRFDSLKTLGIIELSDEPIELQLFDENIFTPKLGSTLININFHGNYSFSISAFRHLKNLASLTIMFDFKIKPMLTKEFFSDSLSNLEILEIIFSGISRFDGDMFINLKSLETLEIYGNNLTEFPKAIEFIPSLKKLIAGHDDGFEIFKKPFKTILPNLEYLEFFSLSSLKSIENCAFCNFPNLKTVAFAYCGNLTWIHENAFGGLFAEKDDIYWGQKVENLESFDIQHCNISVLPEHLLDWSNLKHIYLGDNKFICNCSNAWLIEDIQSSNPAFSDSLKRQYGRGHKSQLSCYGPKHVKGRLLKDISTEGCKEMICEKATKTETFGFFSGFFIAILLMIVINAIIYRHRIKEFYKRTKSNIEHIKLQDYSDT